MHGRPACMELYGTPCGYSVVRDADQHHASQHAPCMRRTKGFACEPQLPCRYSVTEVVRDLTDWNRYNMCEPVARAFGWDTRSEDTMWRDRVCVLACLLAFLACMLALHIITAWPVCMWMGHHVACASRTPRGGTPCMLHAHIH